MDFSGQAALRAPSRPESGHPSALAALGSVTLSSCHTLSPHLCWPGPLENRRSPSQPICRCLPPGVCQALLTEKSHSRQQVRGVRGVRAPDSTPSCSSQRRASPSSSSALGDGAWQAGAGLTHPDTRQRAHNLTFVLEQLLSHLRPGLRAGSCQEFKKFCAPVRYKAKND